MEIVLSPRWTSSVLKLSGTGYIDCGNPAVLSNLSSFTIEAWINAEDMRNGTYGSIISNIFEHNGTYRLWVQDGLVYAYAGALRSVVRSPQQISINEWHHIAYTFDISTNTLMLYIDGVQVAQYTGQVRDVTSGPTMIGYDGSAISFFRGQIGNVMIWNNVRNAAAILKDSVQVDIYDPIEKQNLIFYVDFSKLPAVDRSGNNIPLSFKNDAKYNFTVPSVLLGLDGPGGKKGYVNCGSFADYSRPGNLPYTIEGWFSPLKESTGTIISYGLIDGWEYKVVYQDKQIVGMRNAGTANVSSGKSIVLSSYYHFALTYNEDVKTLSLYINGNLQAVTYSPDKVKGTGGEVLIGAEYNKDGPGNFFNGAVQNLRIWNVCLQRSEIVQWMYNDVISDKRLISNYDFTVNPPIDNTDRLKLILENGAVQLEQQIAVLPTDPVAQLGIPLSINSIYLNQYKEIPDAPPPGIVFSSQPDIFSEAYKQESWKHIMEYLGPEAEAVKTNSLRAGFEASYAEAIKIMETNPRLAKVFTRTDENGMTRIIHHSLKGDTLIYEGAIGDVDDCTLWWATFIYQLTVGFFQALGLIPDTGNIVMRIYNLVGRNVAVMTALRSLAGQVITSTLALGVMKTIYDQGLMWTIIKFILVSASWYTLFWVLKTGISMMTAMEAAILLAGFITWAATLSYHSTKYNANCPHKLQANS